MNSTVGVTKRELRQLLGQVASGRLSVHKATDRLLYEMVRLGRLVVVDDRLLKLEAELCQLNYTTCLIDTKAASAAVKAEIRSKILVTRNGARFARGVVPGYYGLIWVRSRLKPIKLAEKIEAILEQNDFRRNLPQAIKV